MRDVPNPGPQSACKRAETSRRVGVMPSYRARAWAEHRERNRGSARAIGHTKQRWERGGRTSETSAVFSFWQRSHIQASTEPGSTIPHAPEYATRRICLSKGRRFYFYILGQSSPECTRVWHSLHLKTLPEPYL